MSFAARSPLKTLTSTIPINDEGDKLDADNGDGDDDDYDGNGDTEMVTPRMTTAMVMIIIPQSI